MTQLTRLELPQFYRPNFFANTPDILHEYLQRGGRPAFEARLVLAATLSPSYGIYSGFEHFENVPVREGSEEYLDSEKYEVKKRDARRAAAAARRAAERDPPREPRAAAARQPRLPRDRERAADRLRPKRAAGNVVIVVRQPRPARRRRRASPSSRSRSGCRPPSSATDLLTGEELPLAHRPQLRPARPGPDRHVPDRSRRQLTMSVSEPGHWFESRPALVQARGLLRDPHPRLLRRQRRRLRRLPRADREARLPAVARHRLHLAAADVPLAAARRRLRHRRLLRDPPRLRDGRRLPDVRRGGAPARDARDRRPRHEPHLERPPVVPGVALEPGLAEARLVRLVGHRRRATRTRGSSSSTPSRRTGRGTRSPASTTGTASSRTSPTSTTTTPRCRRRC